MCFGAAVGKFNKGSIILMNGGAGSNHYRDLTWYENFYFTPLLVDECLSECYDSCPDKTIEILLKRGKEYLDEVSKNDIANSSDVPGNVHFRDDHVRLEGGDQVL